MPDVLVERGQLCQDLSRALSAGAAGLADVPDLLRRVLVEEAWREHVAYPERDVVRFRTVTEWIEAPPLGGLGATVRQVERCIADDAEVVDLLDRALKRDPGRPTTVDNIHVYRPDGTARTTALRRLRKDRPDLHARVLAGELSANAAAVEAGFRRPTATVPVDSVEHAVGALARRFTRDELRAAIEALP